MKQALIACRTGIGSSMMLKIKVDQVVRTNKLPFEITHGTLAEVKSFAGDVIITMEDVADELKEQFPHVIGIKNLMDKAEIKAKLEAFLAEVG